MRPHRLLSGYLLLVVGCASPGPPKPPSLHLPDVVSDLSAERVGDEVRLRWTTPEKTTDGLDLTGAIVAQVCRKVVSSNAGRLEDCTPVRRAPVAPGRSEAVDDLPDALAHGPGMVLAYQIQLFNRNDRSAGVSFAAFAAAGSAPPPVAKLRVEPTPDGALVRWEPEDSADTVELDRVHLPPVVTTGVRPVKGFGPNPSGKEASEIRLRASPGEASGSPFRMDAGGMMDPAARRGESFVYTAQRVRRVLLDGRTLELRSAMSAPVMVVMRDSFPPQPPGALEAAAAWVAGAPGIDLSWRPNTEHDLAGYFIYRAEANSGAPPGRITPSPVIEPAFHDTDVAAGHTYRYSVTAVDAAGNESLRSAPAQEQVPAP